MQTNTNAGYILNFYSDIKQLTDYLASYSNALLAIKNKIGTKDDQMGDHLVSKAVEDKKITEEEIVNVNTIAFNIRYWTTQIYIKFMGLKDKVKGISEKEKELKALYRKIQQASYPLFDDVEQITIISHQLFSASALGEILIKDQEHYEKMSGLNEPIGDQDQSKEGK